MRAYELMIIVDSDVDDAGVKAVLARVGELIEADGGTVATTDLWGKRRFHEVDRFLRLADDVVRHKTIRLPDGEATRRGLLGAAAN